MWISAFLVTLNLLALQQPPMTAPTQHHHVQVSADSVTWQPGLRPGEQIAILSGDPSKAGSLYTIWVKVPAGGTIPPHWHPQDEHIVVLSGGIVVGSGERVDPANERAVASGSYIMLPAHMRHYAYARTETVMQVYGIGPLQINYVNPADDPANGRK